MIYNSLYINTNVNIFVTKMNSWLETNLSKDLQPAIIKLQEHLADVIKVLQAQVLDENDVSAIFSYLFTSYIEILSNRYDIDTSTKCINCNVVKYINYK